MDFGNGKARMNVEGDRLSILPDDLIHKILSFISIKYAFGTSVLSSRLRFIWTSMPYLNFSSQDFRTFHKFSEFVTNVLARRNNELEVYSVKLSFHETASDVFLERILNYAFSHNVQQLNVSCLLEEQIDFPLNLFRSQSLKYLTLTGQDDFLGAYPFTLASTWELPALTTLYLEYVRFYNGDPHKGIALFSKCMNLKNLTIKHFTIMESNDLSICHPRLSNLTLENGLWGFRFVNVVAPQLENLRIINCVGQHLIYAPRLVSLIFKDSKSLQFLTNNLYSLEKVDLYIYPDKSDASKVVDMLQQLYNVKFLTLNLELVEFLSSIKKLISRQPSPFVNLMSLMIYPTYVSSDEEEQNRVNISTEVKKFLLDGSPRATVTMVSHEEVRARDLMGELDMLLKQWKANNDTNTTHMKQEKPPMHDHGGNVENEKAQRHFGERMAQIENYWNDLNEQFEEVNTKIRDIISMLREIEELLTNVPTSQRANMQTRFSSLCVEADIIVDNMIDCMKIQCDKKPSPSNVYIYELLATTSQPSS